MTSLINNISRLVFKVIICQHCKKEGAEKRRQNTAYVDDKLNFATLCDDCQEEANKYWAEQWAEYYKGCM